MAAKVPVTRRALIQRINRTLAKEQDLLRTTRGEQLRQEVGDYHRVDLFRNRIVSTHVDLEELGRELGALKPYERLAD